jgi:hypothetical protein
MGTSPFSCFFVRLKPFLPDPRSSRCGWDEGSRNERQDVMFLELGRDEQCGEHRITLYPVGRIARTPNPSCTGEGKAQ